MVVNESIASKLAEFLLQIKAVKVETENHFKWSSGWNSPVYCDNRKIMSYPEVRTFVRQKLVDAIEEHVGKPQAIVGVATGGIAPGVLVAHDLGLPFAYVRPVAKKHGLKNNIEGVLTEGASVVVIEDLISTGGSSIQAVEILRDNGIDVKAVISIFNYGFKQAKDNFEKANCRYHSMSDLDALLEIAVEKQYLSPDQMDTVLDWRKNPEGWKK